MRITAVSVIEAMSHSLDDLVLRSASLIDAGHAQVLFHRNPATRERIRRILAANV